MERWEELQSDRLAFRIGQNPGKLVLRTKSIQHTFGLFKETARRGCEYAEEAW